MKRNVDLTLDRKFSRNTFTGFNVRDSLFKAVSNIKYPWEMNMSRIWRSLRSDKLESLVLTGNKDDRKRKKREIEYNNGNSCDCCGMELTKKPWLKSPSLLCSRCDFTLEERAIRTYWSEELANRRHRNQVMKVRVVNSEEFNDIVEQMGE